MKIALIGYGKMGKTIEQIAIERGHTIVAKHTSTDRPSLSDADVAIEFSVPSSAIKNISNCIESNIPVVVGTTGWYAHFDAVSSKVQSTNGALFYASNFSVGVNLFFELNQKLAQLMENIDGYNVEMTEIHHVHKLDAPSGTAITLANGILENNSLKQSWSCNEPVTADKLNIIAERTDEVPGTHSIEWKSEIDAITIKHEAFSRKGFALGAVLAAEFLVGKTGVFTMKDLLHL